MTVNSNGSSAVHGEQQNGERFSKRVLTHAFFSADPSWWEDMPIPQPEADCPWDMAVGWMWTSTQSGSRLGEGLPGNRSPFLFSYVGNTDLSPESERK